MGRQMVAFILFGGRLQQKRLSDACNASKTAVHVSRMLASRQASLFLARHRS